MPSTRMIDISLLGDREAERKLHRLDVALQRKIVRAALRLGARPVRDEAKRLAPVLTGKMRDTITIKALRARRGNFGVQVQTGTRAQLGIEPNDPYYYPAAVEFGHAGPGHGLTPKERRRKRRVEASKEIPANPFMRPALDNKAGEAKSAIAGAIRTGIEREAGKP